MEQSFGLVASVASDILLAVLVAIRFHKMPQKFYPFVFLVWIAASISIMSMLFIHFSGFVNGVSKIYGLIEPVLLLYFFSQMGRLQHKYVNWWTISILLAVAWIIDAIFVNSFGSLESFYRVFYSLLMVFVTMEQINYLIVSVRAALYKEPLFLISIALLVNFAFRSTIEVVYMFHLKMSDDFWTKIFFILQLVNTLSNVTFGVAILWIHKKQKFTLPY